jgi:hypothetical protein
MKTTIDISDSIMDRLRARAARDRTTMRELITAALQQFLSPAPKGSKPFKLPDASVGGNGYAPDIRPGDWDQIRGMIYEGRGGNPLPTDNHR